jgi:hypothetical protein
MSLEWERTRAPRIGGREAPRVEEAHRSWSSSFRLRSAHRARVPAGWTARACSAQPAETSTSSPPSKPYAPTCTHRTPRTHRKRTHAHAHPNLPFLLPHLPPPRPPPLAELALRLVMGAPVRGCSTRQRHCLHSPLSTQARRRQPMLLRLRPEAAASQFRRCLHPRRSPAAQPSQPPNARLRLRRGGGAGQERVCRTVAGRGGCPGSPRH